MEHVYLATADLTAAGIKANLQAFPELATQKRDVRIDLSAVDVIDGSGIGALAFLYKRLRSAGCRVVLINVRTQPLRMLNKLGIDKILVATDDMASLDLSRVELTTSLHKASDADPEVTQLDVTSGA